MEDEVWKVVVVGGGEESVAQQIVEGLADHCKDFDSVTYWFYHL